nr:choice-of-anchor D domain-containing protein [Deltaproteobacteria bacterium]
MKNNRFDAVFLALSLAACGGNDTGLRSLQPELSIAPPPPLAFGEVVVGEPASLDVFVTNAGRAELRVTLSVTAEDDDADVFSVNGEEIVLAPDDSLTVPVTFAPEAFVPYEATLAFSSNDQEQPLFGLAMTGTGRAVPVPDIGLCAEVIDFGDVAAGTTTDEICLIANSGETDLELGAVIQSGSGAFSLVTDPSNALVAPGSSLPVILRYSPATDTGDTAELRFPSNDADEPEVLVQLLGNGGGSATYPQANILW